MFPKEQVFFLGLQKTQVTSAVVWNIISIHFDAKTLWPYWNVLCLHILKFLYLKSHLF